MALEDIFILTCDIQRVSADDNTALLVLPNERSVHIGNVLLINVHLTREDIQSHLDDTVATMQDGSQGVEINAVFVEEERRAIFPKTETHGVAFTDRRIQCCMHDRQHFDIYRADTVITVMCLGLERVEITFADLVLVLPGVWYLVMADSDGIKQDVVCLVDKEREAVDTVTSVDVRQSATIFACDIQGIGIAYYLTVFLPCMNP